jgi:CRP-like cAMP-binding protein
MQIKKTQFFRGEMNKEEILRQIHLFENISDESRFALADICIPKTLDKKEILFLEGDKGYAVYILVNGNIQLYKSAPDGKEVVIKVVKPGELFAEAILFEESRYPVSGVALKPSRVFVVPKHQFTCLLENQTFRDEFIGNLMTKLRYLADQIRYLTNHDVEERLFLFLQEQHGPKEHIVCSLSKKDVAAAIGATPETLSRLLHRLNQEGKLNWEGSKLDIRPDVWKKPERT